MRNLFPILLGSVVCLAITAGCQSTPATATPPPTVSAIIEKDFESVWAETRDVLLDQGLEIYTRDKRGLFVAFTPTKRVMIVSPRRTKLTISLEPLTPQTTRVSVETIKQHYRVTLLTYPDWRDVQKGTDPGKGQALLDAIVAHTAASSAGTPQEPKG